MNRALPLLAFSAALAVLVYILALAPLIDAATARYAAALQQVESAR